MTVQCGTPVRVRPSTMKALLIGISYHGGRGISGQKLTPIPTSIPNVKKFKALLQDRGYTDIVMMTDEDGVEERLRPTKANLKREIKTFSRGVNPGDRRVFYFAGHSDQMPCKTGSEEDGMDEVLVTLYGLRIRDNTLHNWLVKDLPKGSALTAIFDSCTSGTLLDLKHYKCNGVYYPWVNKGRRDSWTLRNSIVRRNGRISSSGAPTPPRSRMSRLRSGEDNVHFQSISQVMEMEPRLSNEDVDKHRGERTVSPERHFNECEGWCRDHMQRKGSLPHADVISIASSNDGQSSWDASTRSGDSISMTNSLVKILKHRPHITYSELMKRLNHEVHSYTRNMHKAVREEKRARRRANWGYTDSEDTDSDEGGGEMDNFQNLQLGSLSPVDMDRIFIL